MARKPPTEVIDITPSKQPREPAPEKRNLPARVNSKARAVSRDTSSDWRKELAQYAAKTVKMEESTQTGNRISTKGGVLTYHGNKMKDNKINVIILAALIENAYYDGPYDPDNPRAPVCFAFSEDGEDMAPHDESHDKQNETCEGCPQNEWGTADRGRGKACKNLRRIAVLSFEDTSTNPSSEEIATLSVSVTSVKGYSAYVKHLAATGLAPWAVRTTISLERPEGKEFSNLFFEQADARPLSEKLYPAILKRVKEAEKLLEQPYVYIEPSAPAVRRTPPARRGAPPPARSSKPNAQGKTKF